jgi:ABC-type polysaccharide/polyol phosphate export permease
MSFGGLKHFRTFYQHRELIIEIAKRDLRSLYKGAVLGAAWAVISPLFQTAAYVVIVTFIFRVRFEGDGKTFSYVIYVLSGMIPWQIITRSLGEAPILIRNNTEIIKQVIFPLETLPLMNLLFTSFGSIVSLGILLLLMVINGSLGVSLLLLPIPFVLLMIFVTGMGWVFSIAGVLIKDLREIITIVLGLMVYASPVILSKSMTGGAIWLIIMANPLSHIVIAFRDVFSSEFHPISWAVFAILTASTYLLGDFAITRAKTLINEYI